MPFYEFNYNRPLFTSILTLELKAFKDSSVFYHIFNILIHMVNSVLVLYVSRKVLQSEKAAIVSALVFALHPVNSEAVAWVFAGSELVKTLFVLISLQLYLLYREDRKLPALVASALFYLLACLGGQGALVLPIVILLYGYFKGYGSKDSRFVWAAYISAAVIYLVAFQGEGEITSVAGAPAVNVYNAITALGFYVSKFVFPFGVEFLPLLTGETYYLTIAMAFIAIPFLLKKERVLERFLLFFVLIMLLPPVLVVLSGASHSLGYRYMYAPSAGFAMLVGSLMVRISGQRVFVASVAVLTLLLAVVSLQRAFVWGDKVGVWAEAAGRPHSDSLIHLNLASSLLNSGRADEAKEALHSALAYPGISSGEFRRAMELLYAISPGDDDEMYEVLSEIKGPSKAYFGMGFYYFDRYSKSEPKDKYMLRKSILFLGNAVKADKNLVMARHYLGLSYLEAGNYDSAIDEFAAVMNSGTSERYTTDAEAYMELAKKLKNLSSGQVGVAPGIK